MSRVLLIDATGLLVRSQRAARDKHLETATHVPTGTLYFFARSVFRYLKQASPTHVLAAWDGAYAREWRQAKYPLYKANRNDPPQWETQAGLQVQRFLSHAGIAQFSEMFFEADDVIAWATGRMPSSMVIIRSDDSDLHQLLRTGVSQLGLGGTDNVTRSSDIISRYGGGVIPSMLPRMRALSGDVSDNIPGVPGIGPKTAVKLLDEVSWDLEAVRHRSFGGNPALRDLVRNFWHILDLRCRVPLLAAGLHIARPEDGDGLQVMPDPSDTGHWAWSPDSCREDLRDFFAQYELRTLADALDAGRLV